MKKLYNKGPTPSSHGSRNTTSRALLEAAGIAVKTGLEGLESGVITVGKATPFLSPIFVGLEEIKTTWNLVQYRKDCLMELHDRCTTLTTWVIVRCERDSSSINVTPLQNCVDELNELVKECSQLGTWKKTIKLVADNKIEHLGRRIDALVNDMGLYATVKVSEQVEGLQAITDELAEFFKSFMVSGWRLFVVFCTHTCGTAVCQRVLKG